MLGQKLTMEPMEEAAAEEMADCALEVLREVKEEAESTIRGRLATGTGGESDSPLGTAGRHVLAATDSRHRLGAVFWLNIVSI